MATNKFRGKAITIRKKKRKPFHGSYYMEKLDLPKGKGLPSLKEVMQAQKQREWHNYD